MKQIPTSEDLRTLGEAIADDGLILHEAAIADVVTQARAIDPSLTAAVVLGDLTAPPVVRHRAFAAVAAAWPRLFGHLHDDRVLDPALAAA